MRIRSFRSDDAPALAQLFYDAVHQVAGRHYSEAQVRAWAPAVPSIEQVTAWASDGRLFLLAVNDRDQPLAFADLEADGHIDHLFCRADLAGTGVTSRLYDELEARASASGLKLLFVEASEPARRFFLRKGFAVDHRRDFEVHGTPIHNYRMEKRL
jgi:putative acetyltransferase